MFAQGAPTAPAAGIAPTRRLRRRHAFVPALVLLVGGNAFADLPQLSFFEAGITRNIVYSVGLNNPAFGYGVALADIDQDGDPDIVVCGASNDAVGLFENDGNGIFNNRTYTSGIPVLSAASGVSAADYDADGDLDLYITRWSQPNKLFRNDGDWTFTDVTASAGVGDAGRGAGVSWGDLNGDGFIDLYLCNRESRDDVGVPPNRLYLNDDGQFFEAAASWGVDDRSLSFQSALFDVDHDGENELYVSNDKGDCIDDWNRLFRRQGDAFIEQPDSGAQICIDSMGIAVGDFNGDAHPDIYASNCVEPNVLLIGDGTGQFVDHAADAQVESRSASWGAIFADFANSGFQQLFVANYGWPNRLYVHDGAWPCVDQALIAGVSGSAQGTGAAVGDLNGDGRLDLVVVEFRRTLRVFINNTPAAGNYLRARVIGNDANRNAIGARLELHAPDLQWRQILCGGNTYKSQNEFVAHFGVGDIQVAGQLVVYWPDGEVRTLHNIPTNQQWDILPDAQLGDFDEDGVITEADLAALAESAAQTGGVLHPGLERLDLDGDFDIDLDDAALLVDRAEGLSLSAVDCDGNGILDTHQMTPATDANSDLVLDACQCLGDLTADNTVDFRDLGVLLAAYQRNAAGDLNGDQQTDAADVAILLERYLSICD